VSDITYVCKKCGPRTDEIDDDPGVKLECDPMDIVPHGRCTQCGEAVYEYGCDKLVEQMRNAQLMVVALRDVQSTLVGLSVGGKTQLRMSLNSPILRQVRAILRKVGEK